MLIFAGLALLATGLFLTALTPAVPPPGYSRAKLQEQMTSSRDFRTHENPTTYNLAIDLPEDGNNGWLGMIVILAAMVPAAIGGGILQPSINSLITKRIEPIEIGGILGISAALLSAANAIAPLIGGLIFQAIGPSAPFILGSLVLLLLLVLAVQKIKPGREAVALSGLARAASSR